MINLNLQYISAFFSDKEISEAELFDEEKVQAKTFDHKRKADFISGRYCAHNCCENYGLNLPILIADDNTPIFPKGIIGSISHTNNLAGAIATNNKNYLSLGLDIETIGRISTDLWDSLFTPNEIKTLSSLSKKEQDFRSTLYFSMKESFYKMQFPITKSFIEFQEGEIVFEDGIYVCKTFIKLPIDTSEKKCIGGFSTYKDKIITYQLLLK